jgi:hypothetical protein
LGQLRQGDAVRYAGDQRDAHVPRERPSGILERFHEEGESAKTTDRTQLQALLKYCRTRKGKVHFVVVYNLTRFAREKYDTSRSVRTSNRLGSHSDPRPNRSTTRQQAS